MIFADEKSIDDYDAYGRLPTRAAYILTEEISNEETARRANKYKPSATISN